MSNDGKNIGVRDTPIESRDADEQGLRVADYAEALARFIRQTETPMTIGIQGDWGSGKTSLMNLIKEQLGDEFPVVEVNTWKYAQTEPGQGLAIAIFLAIIRSLTKQIGGEAKQAVQRIGKALMSLAGRVVESQLGINLTAALAKGELEQIFEYYEALEKLKGQLQELVESVIRDKGTGRDRVVVFVDDLDRVQPERAVEILEILKVFLDIEGLVFVLACDYEVVLQGLRAKTGFGDEQVAGRSFFDKIIQVPFQMPAHTDEKLKVYIKGLFDKVGANAIDDEELSTLIDVLKLTTGTNPRTIKRLVNIMNLLLLILDSEKHTWDDAVKNKAAIVFTLVALQNAYPEAYAVLSNRDPEELFEEFSDEDFEEDPGLKRLTARKPDLSPETLNEVLGILQELVDGDGELCAKFLRISDMSLVQSKTEISQGEYGPRRQAKTYIESQPEAAQRIIRKLLSGLPKEVEYHYSRAEVEGGLIFFHTPKNRELKVKIWSRPRAKRLEVAFSVTSEDIIPKTEDETYLDRLKRLGCQNVFDRLRDWREKNQIGVHIPFDARDDQIEKVRRFVHWFLTGAEEAA